jgi:hypothetical protein
MKSSKQFWPLFKFQSLSNPSFWIMPVAFGFPLLMPLIMGSVTPLYHPGFFTLLMNQNLFFIGISAPWFWRQKNFSSPEPIWLPVTAWNFC